mgnify:FL=1
MARRQGEKPGGEKGGGPRPRPLFRYVLLAVTILAAAVGAVAAFHRAEVFLVNDRRFTLPGPSGYGEECPNIHLYGIEHAPRRRVAAVFAPDYGRSIYLMPVAERRRLLLAIEWVKDATIRRVWPDRIEVHIVEREPVAFVQVPQAGSGGAARFQLIDSEGFLLPPPKARFRLPLITGIRPEQPLERRRDAVRQVQRLLAETGTALAADVSEIDAGDLSNLKVTQLLGEQSLVLMLGNRNFRRRLENFHRHYPEIRAQLAGATILDLRTDDRFTTVETPR